MSIEKKVPEIRFKGFSGEWVEKELKSFCDSFSYGLNASAIKFDGVNKYLRITDIDDKSRRFDYGALTSPDVDIPKSDKYLLKSGDVLFARTGASVGKTYLYNERDGKVFFAGFLIRATVNKKTSPQFIFQNTLTTAYEKFVVTTSQRSGQPGINAKEYAEYLLFSPDELEQTAIGNTFQKLDSLTNQHQQKHDKLSNIKKAMLEKMFPKQGENIPEIRFKGFSGEWEEIGLLDSIERIIDFRGRTPKKLGLDWSPSGYRALSALNVKQGYIDFSIDPHFGDQELYDKWMNGSELHQGQVLFTTEAPMGNVAQVPNADKYILSQRTIAFVVKSEVIAEDFLAVLLRSFKVFRELSALSSGGTAKGVSQKVLANLNVLVPTDLDEQTAIGNYFQKLDALINQHQQQIIKLNNIKQACLNKMFV